MSELKKIDHLGWAFEPAEIPAVLEFFEKTFGVKEAFKEEVADQKVITHFLDVGGVWIELLEPTSPDSNVAKWLTDKEGKKKKGFHHIAYEVADINAAIAKVKAAGQQMIDEAPRPGANKQLIAFVHPKSTHGVMMELCQAAK
ncbi:methylmalonyl-CoA epimerase [Deferribacterales bacterium RsTz2092]|nr:methylmalonyl-CoA epimerase [Deferribacterales bacterium]